MAIPRDPGLDHSLALFAEGYLFVSNRVARHGSDAFRARVLLQEATFALGEEAARVFYEPGRMTRRGAIPPTALRLLQDKGSVQLMDGQAHRHRKEMFLSLMTRPRLERLAGGMADEWQRRLPAWSAAGGVILSDEMRSILCRAVCDWAGVPLPADQTARRTRQLTAMIEGSGSVGPRNWWGFVSRRQAERWISELIETIRSGRTEVPEDSAAQVIAWHRDPQGRLLPVDVATVELINVLRPTVAVARYIVFAALALHQHPDRRPDIADERAVEHFVHEVRRFYPFFPIVGGRVREPFEWRGHRFPQGSWLLLDLYGTNHDPRIWDAPEEFRPQRFATWEGGPFTLVPQGGGDHEAGHRCAGEWLTIELMKRAVAMLGGGMRYDVPQQDLRIDLSRMPAMPDSGFVVTDVRPGAQASPPW